MGDVEVTEIAFALLLVLNGSAPAVLYFPTRDLCEAGAAMVRERIPADWKHVCVPVVGAAKR